MTMGKFASNLFLGALALGLSIFTGSRTLDLLAWALPASQQIYQWLGLAAFEGGMYFWAFFFVAGAKGTQQRTISLIMAVFSVLAVCIATVADLTLDAGQAGKGTPLSASAQQGMIVFVGIVVALNVAAFLATHLMSPEKLREIKAGVAEDHIYAEGLRAIEALAPSMAAEAAPHLAAEWSNRTWARIVPGIPRQTYALPASSPVPALPAPAGQAQAALGKKPDPLAWLFGAGGGQQQQQAPASLLTTNLLPDPAAYGQPAQGQQATPARTPEHRTCSECPTSFVVVNAKQLTCTPACRSHRARRLAKERKAKGQGVA